VRREFHQWLDDQGFRKVPVPNSLVEDRGAGYWTASGKLPIAYTHVINGERMYVLTWNDDADEFDWDGEVYFIDTELLHWMPGGRRTLDTAHSLFKRANDFVERTRSSKLGSGGGGYVGQ
jgi:hypothetical protein